MDWPARATALGEIYARHYPALGLQAVGDVEADLGRPVDRARLLPALDTLTAQIAARVEGVTTTQADRIAALVNAYQGDPAGLRAALEEIGGSVADRAAMIARTETAHVINQATALAVEADGHAACYLTDGTDDPACAAVNGTYQSAAWVLAHTLEHPNCQRRAIAVDLGEVS